MGRGPGSEALPALRIVRVCLQGRDALQDTFLPGVRRLLREGIPSWGAARVARGFAGPMKPMPIGARMFCGDGCDPDEPVVLPLSQSSKATSLEGLAPYFNTSTCSWSNPAPDRNHKSNFDNCRTERYSHTHSQS